MARKATKKPGIRTILELAGALGIDRGRLNRAYNSGYISKEPDGQWDVEKVDRILAGLALTNRRGNGSGLGKLPQCDEEQLQQFREADLAFRQARAKREQMRADKEAELLVSKAEVIEELIRRELELKADIFIE